MSSLADWIEASRARYTAAPALLSPHGSWTYSELAAVARRSGAFLHTRGIAAGSVAATIGNASELAMAAVACAAASVAFLPMDPLITGANWTLLQKLGGARLKRLPPLPCALPDANGDLPCSSNPGDIALVISTSGSEGVPKAVMLTHANLEAAASASNERLPLAPGDIWLDCLPLYHIGGMSILYRCMRAGATVLLHEGFDAGTVWRDLHAHQVTHISLVPAMLARLLDAAADVPPPASLRYALVGGAALSGPLFKRAHAAGWPICPTWGMSECAAQAATLLQPGGNWQEGMVGKLLPGFAARLDSGGRIQLHGAQVMAGYLNPEQRPGDGLDDGWLSTADLGRISADGEITILGRADDVLISGGVNVHPLEVESQLAACPGISDVAVTAVSDPIWGDSLVALVVGTADAEAIRDWSRGHLASAQQPRRIMRIERLPRNAMGKLERSTLRALAGDAA
jgi:O-succinylbenzoic acid--CoA ligase